MRVKILKKERVENMELSCHVVLSRSSFPRSNLKESGCEISENVPETVTKLTLLTAVVDRCRIYRRPCGYASLQVVKALLFPTADSSHVSGAEAATRSHQVPPVSSRAVPFVERANVCGSKIALPRSPGTSSRQQPASSSLCGEISEP
jgi:hypothetical protein